LATTDRNVEPVDGLGALVLTVSDGVIAGTREDRSGLVVSDRLTALGFAI
jgi:molybdopterin biosynthesis enzyme MoaB